MNMKWYRNKPISDPSSLSNAVEQTTHIQRIKVTFIISQFLKVRSPCTGQLGFLLRTPQGWNQWGRNLICSLGSSPKPPWIVGRIEGLIFLLAAQLLEATPGPCHVTVTQTGGLLPQRQQESVSSRCYEEFWSPISTSSCLLYNITYSGSHITPYSQEPLTLRGRGPCT